jgi:hypothetical protein
MAWDESGGAGAATITDPWQEAAERLLPAVVELVRRASRAEPSVQRRDAADLRVRAGLRFPDGIGHGELVADLFRYRNELRLDLRLEHDRMLATAVGGRTNVPCYLNDYQTSVTLSPSAPGLPQPFVVRVVEGVKGALSAVERAGAKSVVGWGLVNVVARRPGEGPADWRPREHRAALAPLRPTWRERPSEDDEETR